MRESLILYEEFTNPTLSTITRILNGDKWLIISGDTPTRTRLAAKLALQGTLDRAGYTPRTLFGKGLYNGIAESVALVVPVGAVYTVARYLGRELNQKIVLIPSGFYNVLTG